MYRSSESVNEQRSALDNFENVHGTCLDTDTAGDTLGRGDAGGDDHTEGTDLSALAAAGALVFIDDVNALRVLGDGFFRTVLRALATLYTDGRFHLTVFLNDPDAGFILVVALFVKCGGAGVDTGQTSHTLGAFFHI
jgi:hypothetical protein